MAAFSGSACYISWVWSGGTSVLSTDYKSINITPTVALLDATAGADTHIQRIKSLLDVSAQLTYVEQSDATAFALALSAGNIGTLTVGPEGTASGKPKMVFSAICGGAQKPITFNGIIEVTCTFTGDGGTTNLETTW